MPSRGEDEGRVRLYRGQDYAKLRAKCCSEAELFLDPEFPADESSLGLDKQVEWKRPRDLVDEPHFMQDADRFSVVQGELGDCWFVSALSAITQCPGLLRRVVPSGQDFQDNYNGIFHFRFWQGGEWVDVVVDDLLPVVHGSTLCFTSSRTRNEFWSALLEKAFAKLHGSYGALNAGKSYEATEDLTGGVTERFLLNQEEPPHDLFSIIAKARQRGGLITCNIKGVGEEEQDTGLVAGHAYCITGARRCKVYAPKRPYVNLVRLRNPWGDETEWRGAWSDDSSEWQLVPQEERDKLQVTVDADGEFWMTFQQLVKSFDELFITSLRPDTQVKDQLYSLADVVNAFTIRPKGQRSREGRSCKTWEEVTHEGSWVRNASAGGPQNNIQLFSTNPQFSLLLDEPDDDSGEDSDDSSSSSSSSSSNSSKDDRTCGVMVSLLQKNRRLNKLPLHSIGFFVYEVDDDAPTPLSGSWLRFQRPIFYTKKFTNTRTVTQRLALSPGHYVVIPCTSKPDQEAEFLLRVFTEKAATIQHHDQVAMVLEPTINKSDQVDDVDGEFATTPGAHLTNVLRGLFLASAGEEPEVDAPKLHHMLNHLFPDVKFSLDLSRSLLAMMDRDFSGRVSYHEFETLVQSLRRWLNVYASYVDEDVGLLSGRSWGLGDALKELGYQVPRRLQALVVVRYGDDKGNISSTDFVMAATRISVMLERFQAQTQGDPSQATFHLMEWLQNTIYC